MNQPPPPPRLNRLLGPTSGAYDGNVRAILAILGVVFVHAILIVLLVGYMKGAAGELKDFLLTSGGALFAADIGVLSYYFGKRSGQTD